MDTTALSLFFTAGTASTALIGWTWSTWRLRRKVQLLRTKQTQTHASLKDLKAQTDLFGTLFEAAPACIKLHDANGIVEQINPAGLRLLETNDPARIVGQPVLIAIAPEYHDS